MTAHPLTIREARQQWARGLVTQYNRAFRRLVKAERESQHYNPRYAPKERLLKAAQTRRAKIEAKLMEALTS